MTRAAPPADSAQRTVSLLWRLLSLVGSLIFCMALFSLLALAQNPEQAAADEAIVRPVRVAVPPPPPPPPKVAEPQPRTASSRPGAISENATPQPLALNPVAVDLDVRPGGALGGSLALPQFRVQTDVAAAIEAFELGQLDRIPRRLNSPPVNYPLKLKREGITGEVRLVVAIDHEGRVRVRRVLSTSHEAFIEPAIEVAEKLRYEPPTVNGEPVLTKDFILPIPFTLR